MGRTLAIAFAVTASVSFVVGSFVLADSLRATFDNLFTELNENVDLEVRSVQEFDTDDLREPVDVALVDTIAAVEGVDLADPVIQRYAQILDRDGEVIPTTGAPTFGTSWQGEDSLAGRHPQGRPSSRRDPMRSPSTRRPPIAPTSSSATPSPT